MARVVFHEHPGQRTCLRGAMRDYMARIPPRGRTLDDVWQHIRSHPFEADRGQGCAEASCDSRCWPAQRSRIWPDAGFNCWEATAHFSAAAQHLLPDGWVVHIWDRDLQKPDGRRIRHCWPSLMSPKGDHFLVDLESIAPRGVLLPEQRRAYSYVIAEPANAEWWQSLLGGVHVAGDTVLKAFGAGEAGKFMEGVWTEHAGLPDWAKRHQEAKAPQPPPTGQTPATPGTPGGALGGTPTPDAGPAPAAGAPPPGQPPAPAPAPSPGQASGGGGGGLWWLLLLFFV